MKKTTAKRFDPSRLARVANEPNLTSLGWTVRQTNGAARWLALLRASLARVTHA